MPSQDVQGRASACGLDQIGLNRLYNSALEERKDTWEKEEKSVTLYDQLRGLTQQREKRSGRARGHCRQGRKGHVVSPGASLPGLLPALQGRRGSWVSPVPTDLQDGDD